MFIEPPGPRPSGHVLLGKSTSGEDIPARQSPAAGRSSRAGVSRPKRRGTIELFFSVSIVFLDPGSSWLTIYPKNGILFYGTAAPEARAETPEMDRVV